MVKRLQWLTSRARVGLKAALNLRSTRGGRKSKASCPPTDQRHNWLTSDPHEWVGRKVRSLRNFAIYTVSEVYKTGVVKLERNWMTYLTDVKTVRNQYEALW